MRLTEFVKEIYRGAYKAYKYSNIIVCEKEAFFNNRFTTSIFNGRALKDQGYESDSTLVFRKKENSQIAPLSPVEQKQAYLNLQSGGEAPIQGFRKAAPEKPKGMSIHFPFAVNSANFLFSNTRVK